MSARPRIHARGDGVVPSYEIAAGLAAAERRRAAESRARDQIRWFARLLWHRAQGSIAEPGAETRSSAEVPRRDAAAIGEAGWCRRVPIISRARSERDEETTR